MSWKKDSDVNGPVWQGSDSVFDPCYEKRQVEWHVLAGIYVASIMALASAASGFPLLVLLLLGAPRWMIQPTVYLCFGVFCIVIFLWAEKHVVGDVSMVNRFYSRPWKLTGANGKLTFTAGAYDGPLDPQEVTGSARSSWTVPLDRIERVEAGLSRDWKPARRYYGAPMRQRGHEAVSPHEYQTYLHLDDGSRRVIFTANADREGSATLAHSIRAWIDAERRKSNRQQVVASGEGFAV